MFGWGTFTKVAGLGLSSAKKLPTAAITPGNQAAWAVLGAEAVPLYSADLPAGGHRRQRPAPAGEPVAVYFPSCMSAMFGPSKTGSDNGDLSSGVGIQDSFLMLADKAGLEVKIPEGIDQLCCGTPWTSKGMVAGEQTIRSRTLAALRTATRDGQLPIVCDASSCTEGLRKLVEADASTQTGTNLRIIDAVEFAEEHFLPHLSVEDRIPSLTLHPTCSSTRMELNASLLTVANTVAENVEVPESWGCCAFAGDRGMLHPELTASATAAQAQEVRELSSTAHASCNRACEIGMSRASDKEYRHVLELLNDVTTES